MSYQTKISLLTKSLLTGFITIVVGVFSATAQFIPDANGIIHVRQGGTGDGNSWANATGNLQSAINAAGVEQVWVAKGTYQPASGQSFSMKQGVAIYGGFPDNDDNADMDDRDWSTHLTTLRGNGNSVVKNENNALTSADILDGFTITGGNAEYGGGIYNVNASPAYINLVVIQNTATSIGGGIAIAAIFAPSAPRLTNVLISKNTASTAAGGMMTGASSPLLTNVTISGNIASFAGEMLDDGTSTAVIRNSIIYGNGVGAQLNDIQNSLVQNQNNAAYTNTAHNNLPADTDPLFVNPAADNFKLRAASPAKDKGNNAFFEGLNLSTKDLAGNPRVYEFSSSGLIDMGAYENQGLQSEPDPNIIYVRQGGTGDGSSWANAMGNLQNAINAAGVDQVWVAKGSYQPGVGQSFSMKRGVAVYGGFPDNNNSADMDDRDWSTHLTTLQGNGSHVVKNEMNGLTPADILDGFTITGGNVQTGAGIFNVDSSPSYINLVITQNKATLLGGGMFIAGMSASSSAPRLTNVLVYGNTAEFAIGGVANNSSPLLTNVTISGNTASTGGSEWYDEHGTAVIRNSIIYGNGVEGKSGKIQNSLVQNQEGNGSYGEAENGNLPTGTNPLFTSPAGGNYTLQPTSPAINKGNNTFFDDLETDAKDLAGNPRLVGSTIDMGAYESPDGALPVRWISFEGRLDDGRRAVLTWKTEETNVSHYEVERSANAKDFHVTGTVVAGGTGSANYSLTDPAPVSGRVYYRVRQVDQDGTFSYSRMISLAAEGRSELFAYPNPVRDRMAVELGTGYVGSAVRLFSPTGVVLQQTEVKEEILTLDMSRYASGIYVLQLHDGKVVKLIKEQ